MFLPHFLFLTNDQIKLVFLTFDGPLDNRNLILDIFPFLNFFVQDHSVPIQLIFSLVGLLLHVFIANLQISYRVMGYF